MENPYAPPQIPIAERQPLSFKMLPLITLALGVFIGTAIHAYKGALNPYFAKGYLSSFLSHVGSFGLAGYFVGACLTAVTHILRRLSIW